MKKKRLGISLYPESCTDEQCFEYLERAAAYGFDVLFLALFMSQDDREGLTRRYLPITTCAKELGFEIHVDVNPYFLKKMGVKLSMLEGIDLSFFTDLKIDAMRLDLGMNEIEEAALSRNKEGVKIVLNSSVPTDHIGAVLANGGEGDNLIGCFNYYPHRFTGMAFDHVVDGAKYWAARKLRLQAFVTSQNPDAFGPWPVDDGIPTMELHRSLPIEVQMKHYAMMDEIADVIISNNFASEGELAAMAAANTGAVTFHVNLVEGVPAEQLERLGRPLSVRLDCTSGYLVRTVESRMLPGSVVPFNNVDIHRGDVLIDNDNYGSYRGEVQIALRDMPGWDRTNVIGHIDDVEHMLLDYLKPSQPFGFTW